MPNFPALLIILARLRYDPGGFHFFIPSCSLLFPLIVLFRPCFSITLKERERESRESTNSITSAIDFIVFPSLVSFLLNFHPFRHLSLSSPGPSFSLFLCFLLRDVFLFSLLPVLTHLSWKLLQERKKEKWEYFCPFLSLPSFMDSPLFLFFCNTFSTHTVSVYEEDPRPESISLRDRFSSKKLVPLLRKTFNLFRHKISITPESLSFSCLPLKPSSSPLCVSWSLIFFPDSLCVCLDCWSTQRLPGSG